MKQQLRKVASPLLNFFESGDDTYAYKASHRTILLAMSVLFCGLASLVAYLGQGEDPGYLLPVVIFGGVGIIGLIVGFLGNERAVAKIWGSRH